MKTVRRTLVLLATVLLAAGCRGESKAPCIPEVDSVLCESHQADCGSLETVDRCGQGRTIDCGQCTQPFACLEADGKRSCGCNQSDAELCASRSTECGSLQAVDRCGVQRSVDCGSCPGAGECVEYGGGKSCVCEAQSDAQLCALASAECGALTAVDRCEAPRTLDCGSCEPPFACGFEQPNLCSCRPESDAQLCARQTHCGQSSAVDSCGQSRAIGCTNCGPGTYCGGFTDSDACSRPFCNDDGFCWESPLPHGDTIYGVWGLAPNDVWMIGLEHLYRFDGVDWTITKTLDEGWAGHRAIHGTGSNDVWIACDRASTGRMLHFDGQRWAKVQIPSTPGLRGVWAASPQKAWAVGQDTVLEWDGTQWTKRASPTGYFQGVWGTAEGEVWIASGNKVYRSVQPDVWEAALAPDGDYRSQVWGRSSNDVWVSGSSSFKHWDGSQWTRHALPVQTSVHALSGNESETWAVGESGSTLRLEGSTWVQHALPSSRRLFGVWVVGGEAWVGGEGGLTARWKDGRFLAPPSATHSIIWDVWEATPEDKWAVGFDGAIAHFDGATWSASPKLSDAKLKGVWGSAPNEVWAVGDRGTVLRWNGQAWAARPSPTSADLVDVWTSGANDVWIAEATKLHHWNGTDWTSYGSPGTKNLRALWGSGPDDVWAVGGEYNVTEAGRILRWDGTRWSDAGCPWTTAPATIWGSGPGDVWVGDLRGFFHWDGQKWDDYTRVTGGSVSGPLCGTAANDVWLFAGEQAFHWDGIAWDKVGDTYANSCSAGADGSVTIIHGGILRRRASVR